MATDDKGVPPNDVTSMARDLFAEAYEGPKPEGSWFTTADPSAGLFGTIAEVDAASASRSTRPGGPTVAGHVEHLRWSLANVNATVRGRAWNPDWSASWSVGEVDEPRWQELREALRREFEELDGFLRSGERVDDPMHLRGLMALAPHAAYHLGVVRNALGVSAPTA